MNRTIEQAIEQHAERRLAEFRHGIYESPLAITNGHSVQSRQQREFWLQATRPRGQRQRPKRISISSYKL